MHHAIGLGFLIYFIAFAFGERTAQYIVGASLIIVDMVFAGLTFLVCVGWFDHAH